MKKLALMLLLAAACGSPKLTAEGTIAVDGQPRKATACSFSGSGVELVMTLKLDDGSALAIPIHGGDKKLERGGKTMVLKDCEKQNFAGSGSNSNYAGRMELSCKGDGAALEMAMKVVCGDSGPSNEVK